MPSDLIRGAHPVRVKKTRLNKNLPARESRRGKGAPPAGMVAISL